MKDDHSEEMREMNSRENRVSGEGLGGHPQSASADTAQVLIAARDMLAALMQILSRSKSNQNDDLGECKRQMFHIENLARSAIAKAVGDRPAARSS